MEEIQLMWQPSKSGQPLVKRKRPIDNSEDTSHFFIFFQCFNSVRTIILYQTKNASAPWLISSSRDQTCCAYLEITPCTAYQSSPSLDLFQVPSWPPETAVSWEHQPQLPEQQLFGHKKNCLEKELSQNLAGNVKEEKAQILMTQKNSTSQGWWVIQSKRNTMGRWLHGISLPTSVTPALSVWILPQASWSLSSWENEHTLCPHLRGSAYKLI